MVYSHNSTYLRASPGVLGMWGEWLFIFRELESTGDYFQGFGEQAHSFGDLGSPAKKLKKNLILKEKTSFRFDWTLVCVMTAYLLSWYSVLNSL